MPAPKNEAPQKATENSQHNSVQEKKNLPQNSDLDARWCDLVEQINKVNPLLASKLRHTYVEKFSSSELKIVVPKTVKFLDFSDPSLNNKLKNYIATFLGLDLNITISSEDTAESAPQQVNKTPVKLKEEKQKKKTLLYVNR